MKQIKYGLYVVAAAFMVSSCEKQLDLQPTDTFSDDNAFLTIADIQLGANAAYGRYGAYANDMYVNALTSDEAKLGLDNAGQGALTYRLQYASDATTGGDVVAAWGAYYSLIDQVNRVLPFVPTVTANTGEEPRRDIIKGQLLALRGIAYFSLLEHYCKPYNPSGLGVPLLLTSSPLGKPARNTMGEVMTQIEKDLGDAKALLPAVTPATFSDTVMNRVNIAAYQARIALYKGDWANAITYSTEVISSNVKPLVTGSDFAGIWTDANANETLFRIRYATSAAIGGMWTTTGGQIYVAPSDKLVAAYGTGDIRKAAYIGTLSPGNNYVNKFYTSSRGGRVVDIKACRIAEMYLIRAEANAKKATPDLSAGAADLNALRAKRITGYVNEAFVSSADLVNALLNERFKELCFEGFRFFDLKRNNLPVQRLASDASAAWQTLAAGSNFFTYPIPRSELNANPNIEQNPGY
ncbi:MAG: RagB/SusD family nutrient uptake outer membrane protein [Chitinophagaceae bacterium]